MTPEEILAKYATNELYHDGRVYDGPTDPIMDAMREYAKNENMRLLEYMFTELFIRNRPMDIYDLFLKHND